MLAGQGFAEVYNLKGGIKAWNGQTAVGPRELGMSHLAADASIVDMLALAYAMEAGLGELYRQIGAVKSRPALTVTARPGIQACTVAARQTATLPPYPLPSFGFSETGRRPSQALFLSTQARCPPASLQ